MRRFVRFLVLLLVLVLPFRSTEEVHEADIYRKVVDILQKDYFYADDLKATDLLFDAAKEMQDTIPWLYATRTSGGVLLSHSDGRTVGQVDVDSMEALPEALGRLTHLLDREVRHAPERRLDALIVRGMLSGLNRYTYAVLGTEQNQEEIEDRRGDACGIGVRLAKPDGKLRIEGLIHGSPAVEAGLKEGDIIFAIDGVPTAGMSSEEAERWLKGSKGSVVRVEVWRPSGVVSVTMPRRVIVRETVEHGVLPSGVAWLSIKEFTPHTAAQVLWSVLDLALRDDLGSGLILDLRGNAGGDRANAIRIADIFLNHGLILHTETGPRHEVQDFDATWTGLPSSVPLLVLVDRRSASASEILAGSLRANDRCLLLGERTVGKSTSWRSFLLRRDLAIHVTTAEGRLAGGASFATTGLVPDLRTERLRLDHTGVRRERRTDDEDADVAFVMEDQGWRRGSPPGERGDPERDLAERILLQATSERQALPSAALHVLSKVRTEEEARLVEAYAAVGLDWRAAPEAPPVSESQLRVVVENPGDFRTNTDVPLRVHVENWGSTPISRVQVVLRTDNRLWDGVVLPLGYMVPAQLGEATATIEVPKGARLAQDPVTVWLESDQAPPLRQADLRLETTRSPLPRFVVTGTLEEREDLTWVHMVVENRGKEDLPPSDLRFTFPSPQAVHLLDSSAHLPSVPQGGSTSVDLRIRLHPSFHSEEIPLELELEFDGRAPTRMGSFILPRVPGGSVQVSLPTVRLQLQGRGEEWFAQINASADVPLDCLVMLQNGEKVLYHPGPATQMELRTPVVLQPGANTFKVVAFDAQGRTRSRTVIEWKGEPAANGAPRPDEPPW